jgi:hypothetical protein
MSSEIKTRAVGEEMQSPCCGKWINLEHVAMAEECPACNTRLRLCVEVLEE